MIELKRYDNITSAEINNGTKQMSFDHKVSRKALALDLAHKVKTANNITRKQVFCSPRLQKK